MQCIVMGDESINKKQKLHYYAIAPFIFGTPEYDHMMRMVTVGLSNLSIYKRNRIDAKNQKQSIFFIKSISFIVKFEGK